MYFKERCQPPSYSPGGGKPTELFSAKGIKIVDLKTSQGFTRSEALAKPLILVLFPISAKG
jgi:hypothetical protein